MPTSLTNQPKKTICLNMIVKNESHVIIETLKNLTSYIEFNYWVISDTGSTDNTKELIIDYFKEKNIDGELVEHNWEDFGHNRTKALESAYGKTDYLLIFDADDRIYGELELPKDLIFDKYEFKFGEVFSYTRPLLINNRIKWEFRGVLHEFLSTTQAQQSLGQAQQSLGQAQQSLRQETTSEKITGDYYIESGKTGFRSKDPKKYYNDAIILEKAFETEKSKDVGLSNRYAFYCAQSYKDAGEEYYSKSIEWYKKCLSLNNWNQEKYYACLTIGDLYFKTNDFKNALLYWCKTMEYDNERIEGIVSAMNHLRETDNHVMVNALYHKYKNYNANPSLDKLFIDYSKYNYELEYNNSISAFYIDDKTSGFECSRQIIKEGDSAHLDSVISNYKFYTKAISNFDTFEKDSKLKLALDSVGKKMNIDMTVFNKSTPSIAHDKKNNRFIVCQRYVNYNIDEHGNYITLDEIITKNIITIIDANSFAILDEFELKYNTVYDDFYFGLEDVRLFLDNNIVEFNTNRCLNKGNIMVIENGTISLLTKQTTSNLLDIENIDTIEKNWVIFKDFNNKNKMIYNWYPIKIGDYGAHSKSKVDEFNQPWNELIITHEVEVPNIFKKLRGSTNGVRIKNEVWFICHVVSYEERRYYYHIVVVLDAKTYELRRYTELFTFGKNAVEYTLGFIYLEKNDSLLIGYSEFDRVTKYVMIPKSKIDALF
jgi:hypothetical protein